MNMNDIHPNQSNERRFETVAGPVLKRSAILEAALYSIDIAIPEPAPMPPEQPRTVPLVSDVVENPLLTEARRAVNQAPEGGYDDENFALAA